MRLPIATLSLALLCSCAAAPKQGSSAQVASDQMKKIFASTLTADGACSISVVNEGAKRNIHLECVGSPIYDAQVLAALERLHDGDLSHYRTAVSSKTYASRDKTRGVRISDTTQIRAGIQSDHQLAEQLNALRTSNERAEAAEVPMSFAIKTPPLPALAPSISPQPSPYALVFSSDTPDTLTIRPIDNVISPASGILTPGIDHALVLAVRPDSHPPSLADQSLFLYAIHAPIVTKAGPGYILLSPPMSKQDAELTSNNVLDSEGNKPLVVSLLSVAALARPTP